MDARLVVGADRRVCPYINPINPERARRAWIAGLGVDPFSIRDNINLQILFDLV
jgi:hypothetical protein